MCKLEGQINWFDSLDSASGKTSPEPSAQMEGKTSRPSSRSSSGSQSRTLPMCLCLKRVDGPNPGVSMTVWDDGALLGAYTTRSFGESPREGNASRLSQIWEACPPPRYSLSARACQGILNRAERRGKKLPEQLEAALIAQSALRTEDMALEA